MPRELRLVENLDSEVEWKGRHHLRGGLRRQLAQRLGDVGGAQLAQRLLQLLGVGVHEIKELGDRVCGNLNHLY